VFDASGPGRTWLAVALLAAGFLAMHELHRRENVPPRAALAGFPMAVGAWEGTNVPLPARILRAVGLDDYLNRVYRQETGRAVTLYISYYASQRAGQTIHSPRNCLPGAGWQPLSSRYLSIPVGSARPLVVNEYDVERGLDQVLVLYWYQERGRDIASEYAAKFWLTADALLRDRTDGALVRVTTPVAGGFPRAERRATAFLRLIFPHLARFIPN
jgi:EpsI family protein